MQKQNPFLFGTLLTISFLTVVALWLPSAKESFSGVLSGVSTSAGGTADTFQKQLKEAQQAMRTLSPTNGQGSVARELSEDTKKELEEVLAGSLTSSSLPREKKQASVIEQAQRRACTRSGGTYASAGLNGVCRFSNNSECDAEMFAYGKCHIGQYSRASDGIPQKADLVLMFTQKGVTVINRGQAASAQTVLQKDPGTYPVPPLAAGASFTVEIPSPQGTYRIDQENLIQEIIEENNTLSVN